MRWRSQLLVAIVAAALGGAVLVVTPAHAEATRVVAFYSMDEAPGSKVLVDSSGNGRNGAIGSEVATGVLFNGASAHRFAKHLPSQQASNHGHLDTVPHTNDFNPQSGDFSFTIRYRTTNSFGNILQKGQSATSGGYWKLEAPGGKPICLFRGGDGSQRSGYTNTSIADGQWHTVTCNRTSTYVEMLVDGVRTSRLNGSSGTIANTQALSIGGKSNCDGAKVSCDYFGGEIDYVRLLKGSGGTSPTFSSAPFPRLRSGTLSTTSIPVNVAWGVSAPSGICSQVAGSTTQSRRDVAPAARALDTYQKPGTPTVWTVDAWSCDGMLARSQSVPVKASLNTLDIRPTAFTGPWIISQGTTFLGGSEILTTTKGATASFTVTARAVELVATREPGRGQATVYVDGKLVRTLDLRTSTSIRRTVVWGYSWSTSGKHTIKVVNLGTSGRPKVGLDALAFLA